MTPEWFKKQIEAIKNKQSTKTYAELLETANKTLKQLEIPGGTYKPPLSPETQARYIEEVTKIKEFLEKQI